MQEFLPASVIVGSELQGHLDCAAIHWSIQRKLRSLRKDDVATTGKPKLLTRPLSP